MISTAPGSGVGARLGAGWRASLMATGLLGMGAFAVHVVGYGELPDDPLPALWFYLVTGVGAVATMFGLCLVAMMPIGLAYSVFQWAGSVAAGGVNAIRYVLDHTWRHLVGRALPAVAMSFAFVVFSLATGGTAAVSFWGSALVWAVPVAVGLALLVMCTWMPLAVVGAIAGAVCPRRLGTHVAEAVEIWSRRVLAAGAWMAAFTTVAVPVAADNASRAPSHLPFTETGWGTYVAGLGGVALVMAAGRAGRRGGRRLAPLPRPPPPPQPHDTSTELFWSPTAVTGWRRWAWDGSVLHGYWSAWSENTKVAVCESCVEVPGWAHTCGIYAVKDPGGVDAAFANRVGATAFVAGRVEMTGLVIEHDRGYRAERARIIELVVPAGIAGAVAERYPDVVVTIQPEVRGGALWPT